MLCNITIQTHSNWAYSGWCPKLTKKQDPDFSEQIFCTELDKMTHISHKDSNNALIKWLLSMYVNDQCPNYLNEVFKTAPENNIQTRWSFQN